MNHGPLVFLGILVTLVTSWYGMIFMPQAQIGTLKPVTAEVSGGLYPAARPGEAQQGAEVYRQQGCYYCHSQQVRQTGATFDVVLIKPGGNISNLVDVIVKNNPRHGQLVVEKMIRTTPVELLSDATLPEAEKLFNAIMKVEQPDENNKLEATYKVSAQGADFDRGWGVRRSVAPDYLFDRTVMLGEQRVGPDLANIGLRQTNAVWHYTHLYEPSALVEKSKMPPYRYLFEKRPKGRRPSPDALPVPNLEEGMEVVPKPEAKALVAYLLSLKSVTPVFETPMPAVIKKEQPATNGVAKAAPAP